MYKQQKLFIPQGTHAAETNKVSKSSSAAVIVKSSESPKKLEVIIVIAISCMYSDFLSWLLAAAGERELTHGLDWKASQEAQSK